MLAAREAYRIDSILCALDEALREKDEWTPAERTVRAVMELGAQVHNGGFHQFFLNPSREFAPTIVEDLRKIGSIDTAGLAVQALGLLKLAEVTEAAIEAELSREDEVRDAALSNLDQQFYANYENEAKLFAFIEANADQFST